MELHGKEKLPRLPAQYHTALMTIPEQERKDPLLIPQLNINPRRKLMRTEIKCSNTVDDDKVTYRQVIADANHVYEDMRNNHDM